MNEKFLATDLTFLEASTYNSSGLALDGARAKAAYDTIQTLTARYNSLEDGKWDGIMSDVPSVLVSVLAEHGARYRG